MRAEREDADHPMVAAHAYFSAAIKRGYKQMIVHKWDSDVKKYTTTHTFNVADARRNYDINNGFIEHICAYGGIWYLCGIRYTGKQNDSN